VPTTQSLSNSAKAVRCAIYTPRLDASEKAAHRVRLPAGGLHHRPSRTEIFLPFVETLVGSIVANLIFGALWRGAPCKLRDCRYLLHDRDTKYTPCFRAIIASGRVEPLVLPACSPNLNAYAERWVRSVKEECLSKAILFGERSLR
jgi:hypothetical protein